MGLLSKLLGGQAADSPRTPRERARRAREISRIDAGLSRRLPNGFVPRKGR